MSDYVFEIGEDNFPKFNREYVSMNTSEGLRITIALVVSGIPFSGHFDKNRISFAYDGGNAPQQTGGYSAHFVQALYGRLALR